jgi:hypothetical protein
MADSFTQVAPDSTGDKVDGEELTVGANTVIRQRVQVVGAAVAEIAAVSNSKQPAQTLYAPVVRPLFGGEIKEITVTSPAAGAGWVQAITTGKIWRLLYGKMRFVSNATAARRGIEFYISDGSDDVFKTGIESEIFASLNNTIYMVPGGGALGRVNPQSNVYHLPMPSEVYGLAGWFYAALAVNIQTTDQFSDIRLIVEEFTA